MINNLKCRTVILLVALAVLASPTLGQSPNDSKRNHGGETSKEQSAISAIPDGGQFRESSVPVVVRRVVMSTDKEYYELAGIKGGALENRSSKVVRRVKLYWFVTLAKDRGRHAHVFDKGETEFVEVVLPTSSTADLKFSLPKMNERVARWREISPTYHWFAITIGIAEVQFEDGSLWKAATIAPIQSPHNSALQLTARQRAS